MIPIRTYKDYWEGVQGKISQIKHLLFVHNEVQLADKIRNIKPNEPILIVIIPSSDSNEIEKDDINDISSAMIFVVQKIDIKGVTDSNEMDVLEDMQNIIYAIKYLLHKEATDCSAALHAYFERTNFGSMHCDPEKNLLGCDGWSLSFNFTDVEWTKSEEELLELFPNIME
jgi:hypothetical protein